MFPQLFHAVPDALLVVDETGRISIANRQAERLFGYAEDGLTGLGVEQLIPEDARERHRSHRCGYMRMPRIRPMGGAGMALIGQRRDGAQFPVEIALSPLQTDEGPRYLASIRDISETQRAREALVRARHDALVARIGQEAVELADGDELIARLPQLLTAALGADAVAIAFFREKPLVEVQACFGAPALSRGLFEVPEHWQQLSSSRPRVIDDLQTAMLPLPLLGGDKGSGAVVPLIDRDHPMGVIVVRSAGQRALDHDAMHLLRSIANLVAGMIQRRRTEEQLAHAQRLDAIGQLTGGIAHDFNNLLTVMSGSLQLLADRSSGDPESADLIASASRSACRGAELTRKLLAFARRQRLSPSAVSPPRLLEDLEHMLRRTLGDSIRLIVECPPTIPAVHADAAQLDSALLNLVLNARDAMPQGGEIRLSARQAELEVETDSRVTVRHPCIMFSVTDTGHGMTTETMARAVEPFFTTKPAGRGSGLGLSMVYGFAEQSGGKLRIDSRLGHGTRVVLLLPAAPVAIATSNESPRLTQEGHGELVLVVEDEPAVRDIALAFLRSLGYRASAVGSATDALEHLSGNAEVRLLFTDVMLGGGMNGVELAKAAKASHPGLGILLTSGYEDVLALDPIEAPTLAPLRKPYSREDLAAALHRSLSDACRQKRIDVDQ
ncbi:PAS domain S-box protein [Pseudoxanthomonas sp. SE1]|uniref:PAS domain S-box protein n=1 Tax=Pseudoxanthomonas sp. SE1 TaxID=1664560 RepID=UPI00240D2113|nr:PAS domain S-box protein [Pseudoxanthomonas sp. SE1]WFC41554.1 PAS domain S-box protein [Pseudoxanthomonas sp. SE1]